MRWQKIYLLVSPYQWALEPSSRITSKTIPISQMLLHLPSAHYGHGRIVFAFYYFKSVLPKIIISVVAASVLCKKADEWKQPTTANKSTKAAKVFGYTSLRPPFGQVMKSAPCQSWWIRENVRWGRLAFGILGCCTDSGCHFGEDDLKQITAASRPDFVKVAMAKNDFEWQERTIVANVA